MRDGWVLNVEAIQFLLSKAISDKCIELFQSGQILKCNFKGFIDGYDDANRGFVLGQQDVLHSNGCCAAMISLAPSQDV